MKPKYIDVLEQSTIGCLQNNSSIGLSFQSLKMYNPQYIYLNEYQANELLQKLTEAINNNKRNPLDDNIKKAFNL